MEKGIRVNALANELGVTSARILDKLKEEGLGEKAPNFMSVLPLGLAESVREWFNSDDGMGPTGEADQPKPPAPKLGSKR